MAIKSERETNIIMGICEVCEDTISRFNGDIRIPKSLFNYLFIVGE